MGENEDSTRCRVYKSCNIEEKCHEWWLHFPRIKYPWHGVKPTTRHRDNSLSTIPFALTRYRPLWKKSNDTEFPFSKFPPHSTVHVVSAGRQRNSIFFSESRHPFRNCINVCFSLRCTATNGSDRGESLWRRKQMNDEKS